MAEPLVSIIIPVYNAEKYIFETITSALNQTWQNIEVIIIDDGSADRSLEIANTFNSKKVKVFSQSNKGAAAARNHGLKKAQGDYIQFLDADDLLSTDKIEGQLNCLDGSASRMAICQTMHFFDDSPIFIDEQTNKWVQAGSDDSIDFLIKLYAGSEVLPGYGGMITIHSWLSPRQIIDKAGLWNEQLTVDDDGEFFCRAVLCSDGIKYSDTGVNYYRKFKDQRSLSAQRSLQNIESTILATDFKYQHLKQLTNNPLVDRIFARHYWFIGVSAYPQFRSLSSSCIKKSMELGYTGEKYLSGPITLAIAGIFGWKTAQMLTHYRQLLKNYFRKYKQ